MGSETENNMILYLNQDALNTLFPEGTEARIKLGEAVLAKAVSTHVKGLITPEVSEMIAREVRTATAKLDLKALIGEAFQKTGWQGGPYRIIENSGLDATIKSAVSMAFTTATFDVVEKEVNSKVELLTADIEKRVNYEVDRRLAGVTKEMITSRVNEALANIKLA